MSKVDNAFVNWKKTQLKNGDVVGHQFGCPMQGRSVPIDECNCDCYEFGLFSAGFKAGESK